MVSFSNASVFYHFSQYYIGIPKFQEYPKL
jgi:hypothetical protein